MSEFSALVNSGFTFVLVLTVYFFPTVVAFAREHSNRWPIFILNLLLGWTLLFWVFAMVWSLTSRPEVVVITNDTGRREEPLVLTREIEHGEERRT